MDVIHLGSCFGAVQYPPILKKEKQTQTGELGQGHMTQKDRRAKT